MGPRNVTFREAAECVAYYEAHLGEIRRQRRPDWREREKWAQDELAYWRGVTGEINRRLGPIRTRPIGNFVASIQKT